MGNVPVNDLAYIRAVHELFRAVLRSAALDYADQGYPNFDAECQHVEEQLCLAARDLVKAVDARPEDEQPVGWAD